MRISLVLLMLAIMLAGRCADVPIDTSPCYDIPRLTGITLDGDPADWGDRGFRVGPLLSLEGDMRPAQDFTAAFRLGWNDEGLLFLGIVHDDFIIDADAPSIGGGDAVEIFMAPKRGMKCSIQAQFTSGADPRTPTTRSFVYDYRPDKDKDTTPPPTARGAGKRTPDGYVLEALIPWKNLNITPALGTETAVQVWMTDRDSPVEWFRTLWYPQGYQGGSYTENMYRIRLADKASSPILTVASGAYERFRRARLHIYADATLIGKTVRILEGRRTLSHGTLASDAGIRGEVHFTLPMPPPGKPYRPFTVLVDGKRAAGITLPDNPDIMRAQQILRLAPTFRPAVFSGAGFPPCEFENPQYAEDLIGLYTIRTSFYDSDFRPVVIAEKPGRYGAVIEVIPEHGKPLRRFRTIFRLPDGVRGEKLAEGVKVQLPTGLGLNTSIQEERQYQLNALAAGRYTDGWNRDNADAVLLASLYDDQPGAANGNWFAISGWLSDRQYWVTLKRKLYGNVTQFAAPFVAPKPFAGTPAPVVHEGTLQEAGMKADTREKLDALCTEWAAHSKEAFATCVVRHGVIIHHKAYGIRDGQPMTVDTPSYMASNTKFLGGMLLMTFVDQGLVKLDDPVEKFLPPFRGIPVKTTLTVQHCYTHTNGGWDHWGDWDNDFEEILGSYYPLLEVGVRYSYNGMGTALGGHIMEAVSGEALTTCYQRHLLAPLGCTHTRVNGTYADAASVPLDMAKIAQMVMNKGVYGNLRFFSEDTYAQMIPKRLTAELGPDTPYIMGIGCSTMLGEELLGKHLFGHGASSGATLLIAPDRDLVIIMTRNAPGENFAKYHDRFIHTIVDGIAD